MKRLTKILLLAGIAISALSLLYLYDQQLSSTVFAEVEEELLVNLYESEHIVEESYAEFRESA